MSQKHWNLISGAILLVVCVSAGESVQARSAVDISPEAPTTSSWRTCVSDLHANRATAPTGEFGSIRAYFATVGSDVRIERCPFDVGLLPGWACNFADDAIRTLSSIARSGVGEQKFARAESDPLKALDTVKMSASKLTKWGDVKTRFDNERTKLKWRKLLSEFAPAPTEVQLKRVNERINRVQYVADPRDVWQTPLQTLSNGGDCEDYAIAKYMLLRDLGIPVQNMRIGILNPTKKMAGHAILIVFSAQGQVVLDNLRSDIYPLLNEQVGSVAYAFNDDTMWVSLGKHTGVVASNP